MKKYVCKIVGCEDSVRFLASDVVLLTCTRCGDTLVTMSKDIDNKRYCNDFSNLIFEFSYDALLEIARISFETSKKMNKMLDKLTRLVKGREKDGHS